MKNLIVNESITIKESLYKLESNRQKCLLAVNKKGIFVGTLNDGDIRRAIILGANIDSKIASYIKRKPFSITIKEFNENSQEDLKKMLEKLAKSKIDILPILDNKRKIVNFIDTQSYNLGDYVKNSLKKIPLIIMAGGKGVRLKPFTDIFPKPLMPIDNLPAAEHIINFFRDKGIFRIYLTLNYKKELIKSYFEDKNFNLKYVEEKKELGTAGSLAFFKKKIKSDFFVCNCDTLLNINIKKFYEYHKKGKFDITLVVATKNFGLPYGSCEIDNRGNLKKITEKPTMNYLVNTGLYLMKPSVINLVSNRKSLNMDQLIKLVKKKGKKIGIFPISEKNWTDVGEWSEYNKLILKSKKDKII